MGKIRNNGNRSHGRRNTPARSAKQVTRRINRDNDPRVREAREQVALEERKLHLLEAHGAEPEGAQYKGQLAAILAAQESVTAVEAEIEREEQTPRPSISCPVCGATSYNPNDIREGYCALCKDWTSPPAPKEEAPRRRKPDPTKDLPMLGDGNGDYSLGTARKMLRDGYNIRHVVTTTGWGLKWFSDGEWDEDGFGIDWLVTE